MPNQVDRRAVWSDIRYRTPQIGRRSKQITAVSSLALSCIMFLEIFGCEQCYHYITIFIKQNDTMQVSHGSIVIKSYRTIF